jgi:hypothetical protein
VIRRIPARAWITAALPGSALLLAISAAAAPAARCHIHPPADETAATAMASNGGVATIGPFDSIAACEAERHQLFGAGGRCHCAAGFTPGWIGPVPDRPPAPGDLPGAVQGLP